MKVRTGIFLSSCLFPLQQNLPTTVDMPFRSSPTTSTAKSLVAVRATALSNAGIRPHRAGSKLTSKVASGNSDHADPAITETRSFSVDEERTPVTLHQAQRGVQETTHNDLTDELPVHCVMGTAIPMGRPVSRVQSPEAMDMAFIRSIQANKYKLTRHMICWDWNQATRMACNFSFSISHTDGQREVWKVEKATPLHYAVCCGAFEAAAACLIAFPHLASSTCKVQTRSGSMLRERMWTPLDLTGFLARAYLPLDSERSAAFERAWLVLLQVQQDPSRLPFVNLASPRDRIAAAGPCPLQATTALLDAVHRCRVGGR